MKHAIALLPAFLCGCVVAAPRSPADLPPEAPYFATWSTVDERGIAGDCKDVADVVRISARDPISGEASVFTFDCRANRGDLGPSVSPGATVRVELVDCHGVFCFDGGTLVSGFSLEPVPSAAPSAAAGVDLGPFAFDAL